MSIDDVSKAIEAGKIEKARNLLRPLMDENNPEAFHLASRVAYTQEQALEFLRYALQLDPTNDTVRQALTGLESLYTSQQAIIPANPATSVIKEKLEATAIIFQKHGWQLVEQDDDMVHLSRRRSVTASSAFIMGLLLHLPGLLITLWSVLTSEKIHVFIEADADNLLITSNKAERLISKPQQAILIVESIRGTTLRQAIFWSLFGVLLASAGWYGMYWYANFTFQNIQNQMQDLQSTLAAEPSI